jgi:CubicO group peptidase (beta-lactamase class C family)
VTPLAALLEGAAFPEGTPVAIARVDREGTIEEAVTGTWPGGAGVTATDRFYAASIGKQVTAAAIALLVRSGALDADARVADLVEGMPACATAISVRQLLHHTSGLADAGEPGMPTEDWTDDFVMAAVRKLEALTSEPGVAYCYSNVGYVLLAQVVGAVGGMTLARFADANLFQPLGLDGIAYAGTDLGAFPQAAALGPAKPLSHGDGGLWTTARGFAGWLHAQNGDRFGIAPLVTAPGRLPGGAPVDYGWGIGLRSHRNRPLYSHGGSWTGAFGSAVRSPHHDLGIVAFASGESPEPLEALVAKTLDDATV